MTLLQQRDAKRRQTRLDLYDRTRRALRSAVHELLPHARVMVFGSLVHPGRFNEASDVDIALFEEPADQTTWRLQADLEERLGRPVDIVMLPVSRLREKILREGEVWTTSSPNDPSLT